MYSGDSFYLNSPRCTDCEIFRAIMPDIPVIIPSVWNYYPCFLVGRLVHAHLVEHWDQYHSLTGVTITLENVTAVSEYYVLDIIWFRIVGDVNDNPFREDYYVLSI
ncbi:hypothetical protein ORF903 [Cotesia plutellae polydnavirus]|nr:hypothetical protein ORF903 [Cotesia plutellae polydnavirus]AEE09534.1 conserved hypothetical protein [Cotesia vestalis bracovirus]